MDYYNKYLKQIKNIGNFQFDRYIQLYYSKDDSYIRSVLPNGDLQLKTKNGKTTIKLTFGKYNNIYKELNKLLNLKKKYINDLNNLSINSDLLFSSEDVKFFNDIKNKMILNQKSLDSINDIIEDKTKLEISLVNQINNLHHNLFLLYKKRQYYFDNFSKIEGIKLNYFQKIFLKEKIDNKLVETLSQKLKIKTKIIKNIFNWLLICKKYIKLQNTINISSRDNYNQIEHVEEILKNFILEDPIVDIIGDKLIKVKKSSMKNKGKVENIEVDELEEPNINEEEEEDEEENKESSEDEEDKLVDSLGVETAGEEAVEDVESSDGESEEEPGEKLQKIGGGEKSDSSEEDLSVSSSESEDETPTKQIKEDIKIINISNPSLTEFKR